uniref:Uncharacterized protein n=1 Tax=Chromera velia CCMP2878 TaxID=1169474 RepID=A0A0G4GP01_9ALVE|eukprot:Cvel_5002.t1-p1 / transcript=Cvel_5002.t1 / gene=Cvel_5002 / organism=Chromera_velia_CCMP2878 / gene_product=hypothetical protein / transcript_product=hypothetical protein / location=Cvel_scaffold226:95164-103030(+) / protein_length=1533 / sequence_SO=supercontig / SO=protein_coding / is_pseudo=false
MPKLNVVQESQAPFQVGDLQTGWASRERTMYLDTLSQNDLFDTIPKTLTRPSLSLIKEDIPGTRPKDPWDHPCRDTRGDHFKVVDGPMPSKALTLQKPDLNLYVKDIPGTESINPCPAAQWTRHCNPVCPVYTLPSHKEAPGPSNRFVRDNLFNEDRGPHPSSFETGDINRPTSHPIHPRESSPLDPLYLYGPVAEPSLEWTRERERERGYGNIGKGVSKRRRPMSAPPRTSSSSSFSSSQFPAASSDSSGPSRVVGRAPKETGATFPHLTHQVRAETGAPGDETPAGIGPPTQQGMDGVCLQSERQVATGRRQRQRPLSAPSAVSSSSEHHFPLSPCSPHLAPSDGGTVHPATLSERSALADRGRGAVQDSQKEEQGARSQTAPRGTYIYYSSSGGTHGFFSPTSYSPSGTQKAQVVGEAAEQFSQKGTRPKLGRGRGRRPARPQSASAAPPSFLETLHRQSAEHPATASSFSNALFEREEGEDFDPRGFRSGGPAESSHAGLRRRPLSAAAALSLSLSASPPPQESPLPPPPQQVASRPGRGERESDDPLAGELGRSGGGGGGRSLSACRPSSAPSNRTDLAGADGWSALSGIRNNAQTDENLEAARTGRQRQPADDDPDHMNMNRTSRAWGDREARASSRLGLDTARTTESPADLFSDWYTHRGGSCGGSTRRESLLQRRPLSAGAAYEFMKHPLAILGARTERTGVSDLSSRSLGEMAAGVATGIGRGEMLLTLEERLQRKQRREEAERGGAPELRNSEVCLQSRRVHGAGATSGSGFLSKNREKEVDEVNKSLADLQVSQRGKERHAHWTVLTNRKAERPSSPLHTFSTKLHPSPSVQRTRTQEPATPSPASACPFPTATQSVPYLSDQTQPPRTAEESAEKILKAALPSSTEEVLSQIRRKRGEVESHTHDRGDDDPGVKECAAVPCRENTGVERDRDEDERKRQEQRERERRKGDNGKTRKKRQRERKRRESGQKIETENELQKKRGGESEGHFTESLPDRIKSVKVNQCRLWGADGTALADTRKNLPQRIRVLRDREEDAGVERGTLVPGATQWDRPPLFDPYSDPDFMKMWQKGAGLPTPLYHLTQKTRVPVKEFSNLDPYALPARILEDSEHAPENIAEKSSFGYEQENLQESAFRGLSPNQFESPSGSTILPISQIPHFSVNFKMRERHSSSSKGSGPLKEPTDAAVPPTRLKESAAFPPRAQERQCFSHRSAHSLNDLAPPMSQLAGKSSNRPLDSDFDSGFAHKHRPVTVSTMKRLPEPVAAMLATTSSGRKHQVIEARSPHERRRSEQNQAPARAAATTSRRVVKTEEGPFVSSQQRKLQNGPLLISASAQRLSALMDERRDGGNSASNRQTTSFLPSDPLPQNPKKSLSNLPAAFAQSCIDLSTPLVTSPGRIAAAAAYENERGFQRHHSATPPSLPVHYQKQQGKHSSIQRGTVQGTRGRPRETRDPQRIRTCIQGERKTLEPSGRQAESRPWPSHRRLPPVSSIYRENSAPGAERPATPAEKLRHEFLAVPTQHLN